MKKMILLSLLVLCFSPLLADSPSTSNSSCTPGRDYCVNFTADDTISYSSPAKVTVLYAYKQNGTENSFELHYLLSQNTPIPVVFKNITDPSWQEIETKIISIDGVAMRGCGIALEAPISPAQVQVTVTKEAPEVYDCALVIQ